MILTDIKKEIKDIARLEHIMAVLVRKEMGFLVDAINIKHMIPHSLRSSAGEIDRKKTQPKIIKETFEELGGAFIKLAQFLSLRPDLIPKEYCEEFKKLQDRVKPFDGSKALEIVNRELDGTNKKLKYFNKIPLASGSVAQVHEAVLGNGKRVVIKVQRENAREMFTIDIDILKHAAKIIGQKYGNDLFNAMEIVEEFERYTLNELDFLKEGKNIERFYENFQDCSKIKIPKMFWDYTTERILAMEFIQGENIENLKKNKASEKRRKKIVTEVTEIIFKQIFEHGFFHADPHPGNIFVMKDDTIVLLDFGIVGIINNNMKEKLTELFISLIEGNSDGVAESFIELNIADKGRINKIKLKEDLRDLLGEYYNTSLDKLDIGALFHNAINTARKNNLHMPTELILLGKALVTVEGFCVELYPEYNLVETCKPYMLKLKKREFSPKVILKNTTSSILSLKRFIKKIPERTEDLVDGIKDADKSMNLIDNDLQHLNSNINKSVNRVSLVILSIGFLLASVFMMNFGKPYKFGIPFISLIGFCASLVFLVLLFYHVFADK